MKLCCVRDTTDGGKPHPVILRRGSSKEEKEKKRINRESGALFSERFKVATSHSSGVWCDHHIITVLLHCMSCNRGN